MRSKRVLTLLLAVCMVVSLLAPAASAVTAPGNAASANIGANASEGADSLIVSGETANGIETLRDHADAQEADSEDGRWVINPSDRDVALEKAEAKLPACVEELRQLADQYADDELVSAFVVMEAAPLVSTYSSIAAVPAKRTEQLKLQQNALVAMIEEDVLDGRELEVTNQFTYLTNSVVICTEFGNLEQIARLPGVKSVFLNPVYHVCDTDLVNISRPYTASAGEMTGVPTVWESIGLTGSGMKIAVIDTGLDLDHPSFAAAPADPALDADDIAAVLEDLNATSEFFDPNMGVEDLYYSEKVPFQFNYVDAGLGLDASHENDEEGDHGTHVAGIAAANAVEGTDVVGMAPDAQIIVMKVFGYQGGAYMDDIVAALEDAMTLGCDVANLSLGSSAGFSEAATEEISAVYESLAASDMIVNISAGNDGNSSYGNLWGTDMNTTEFPDNATVSSPSTYANVNSIASVDNVLVSGPAIYVDGVPHAYNDGLGLYVTFSELAANGEMEYVMVPGLGEADDFEGLDVEGRIAVIARGTTAFTQKLFNAEQNGAIGVIITNNVPGSISNFGMSMTDEYGNLNDGISGMVPCILVSQATGEALAALENKVVTASAVDVAVADEAGGQISAFSAWGAAPDLSLVPDMAGVGGNVYSCYDNGKYGYMSGTSMSCPQVSGMSALVVEYLKEQVGITDEAVLREMASSLMMSTAVPVITGSGLEASPRQQGAGLVNALNAVTSGAYLSVEGCDVPKAALGDGNGTYSFTFTVHNFSDESKTYTLGSSLLTEDVVDYGRYFLAGTEISLDGTVSFSADTVTVAAGSTAEIGVTVSVSQQGKSWLEEHYPNGGFVEGFVYLYAEDGVDLSLPFMGFCGDWTKAPAFDSAFWYETGLWDESYTGVDGNATYTILWTSLDGQDWMLGLNPYTGPAYDENGSLIYDSANNTVSPNGDGLVDGLFDMYISLMRNAKYLSFTYTDEAGNVLDEQVITNAAKAMYMSAYAQVVPFVYSWYAEGIYDFTDENGEPLPHGTKLTLTVTSEQDYEGEYTVQSISFPITVDTQAPQIVGEPVASTADGRNYVTVTLADDAPAYVALMNPTGTRYLDEVTESEFVVNGDGTVSVTLDVTGHGSELLLVACDYAVNEGYYELSYENNDPVLDTDALYAYRVYDAEIYDESLYGWITIDKQTAEVTQLTNDMYEYYALTAAEYVDGYVFAVDAGHNLVVMEPGLWNRHTICNLGTEVLDMTFDKATNTMYVTTKVADPSGYGSIFTFATLDLLTGELNTIVETDDAYELPYAMAAADDGTIYAVKYYNSYLYTVDKETGELTCVTDAEGNDLKLMRSDGKSASPYYSQSMTYSSADNCIYWAFFTYTYDAELFAITPADESAGIAASYTAVEFPVDAECVGLLTLDEDEDYQIPEAESVSRIVLDTESVLMKKGDSQAVSAVTLPWNYTPAEQIVWTSADESVATVDEYGVITGVEGGMTTVTATCEGVSAQCEVTVVAVTGNVYAYDYYNGVGDWGDWINIDLETLGYEHLWENPIDFIAADYNGHDGYIYGYDMTGQFYRLDPETQEYAALGAPVSSVPMDMAYDYSTGFMYAVTADQSAWTSTLHYVNMKTGALVEVGTTYEVFMTLACDTNGQLYAISYEGVVYNLMAYEYEDWWTGEMIKGVEPMYLMQIPVSLAYAQSMCYDHANDVLLWACPEVASLYWVDFNQGYYLDLGNPTGDALFEYIGMYTIPAQIPELAYVPVAGVAAEDMLILTGATVAPAVSVNPLNATNQDITYTVEDESIVTVSEDGWFTGVAEGVTTVTGTLTDGEAVYEFTFSVAVKSSADNIYGYIAGDLYSGGSNVWAQLSDSDPTNGIEYLESTDYMIYSEEYVDGVVYAFGYDNMSGDWDANMQFMTIDPDTFQILSMQDMGDGFPFVYDMTYDYTTGTMYAVAGYNDSSSDVYMVSMETGALIPVLSTEPFFQCIAADAQGNIYAMSASASEYDPMSWSTVFTNAVLYKLDLAAGTYEPVFDTGVQCNKLASMAFDLDTGNLYWTPVFNADFWSPYTSGMYMVDIEAESCYDLGLIGPAGSQVTGLYIIADAYPETPAVMGNLALSSSKEELNVGQSVQLDALVQPNGLDVELVWTSADETVATVDAEGNVTGVGAGVTTVTVTVVSDGKTFSATCAIIVYGENDGFLTYNVTDGGFAMINRGELSQVTNLTEGESDSAVRSMELVDGVIYGYDVDNGFFTATAEGGYVRNYLGSADLELPAAPGYELYYEVRDMAYDAANERMLALTCITMVDEDGWSYEMDGGCRLHTVDLTTGALTELCTFSYDNGYGYSNVYAIAVSPTGTVYYYSSYMDYVGTVDTETGVVTDITTLQNQSLYGDSEGSPMAMVYDPVSCNIFLLFTTNGTYYQMVKFSTADQSLTALGDVGEVVFDDDTWTYNADSFAGLTVDAEHTHAWSEWSDHVPATCTEDGEQIRHCLLCGAEESRTVPAGHSYVEVVVAPTCTEDGYTVHTCAECGDSYTDTVVPAIGHAYGEFVVVQEPQGTENGYMEAVCGNCGDKLTVYLYAVLHGDNGKWTQGSDEGFDATANAREDTLIAVTVDGVELSAEDYTVSDDGMTVTLTPEFLAALETGEHALVLIYSNGFATVNFTVAKKAQGGSGSADTGDSFQGLWIAAMAVSLAGAAVLVLGRKKLFVK